MNFVPLKNSLIDERYRIGDNISQKHGNIYILYDEKDGKKKCVLKLYKFLDEIDGDINLMEFKNEKYILEQLKDPENKYIINLIKSGTTYIRRRENEGNYNREYIILEFAEGNLWQYLYSQGGFPKNLSKLLFYNILQGIKECHKKNICHLDIRPNKILLDQKYNVKIAGFDFAVKIKDNKLATKKYCREIYYFSPQILFEKEFDGFKADIFSLGALLFTIVTGENIINSIDDYCDLKNGKIKKKLEKKKLLNAELCDDNLINLILDLINFEPEKRPDIDEILKNKWFQDIKDNKNLEIELRIEFEKRGQNKNCFIINANNNNHENNYENNKGSSKEKEYQNRFEGYEIEEKEDFKFDDIYVKINGELDPCDFMSELLFELNKLFFIDKENNGEIKFIVKNEYDEEEDNSELEKKLDELGIKDCETAKNYFSKKDLGIELKIFRSNENTHLIRFIKKYGEIEDYYDSIKIIISEIKKILN